MKGGSWLVIDGKKVAAGPDGKPIVPPKKTTAKPPKVEDK